MLKVKPADGYPPEEGRYLRGNDFSPVAVCVILKWPDDEIPEDIEKGDIFTDAMREMAKPILVPDISNSHQ